MCRWIWLLGAGLMAATPTAGQVYLHSQREETATTQLSAALAAARKGHSEALDRHDANLEAGFAASIDALVAERLAARDLVLARYVNNDDHLLRAKINVRLLSLTEKPAAYWAAKPDPASSAAGRPQSLKKVRDTIFVLEGSRAAVAFLATTTSAGQPRCNDSGLFKATDGNPDSNMIGRCENVRTARENLARLIPCDNEHLPAWHELRLAGPTDLCWKAMASPPANAVVDADPHIVVLPGAPGIGISDVTELRAAIARQSEVIEQTRKIGAELNQALKTARDERATGPTEAVRGALLRLDRLIADLQTIGLADGSVCPRDPADYPRSLAEICKIANQADSFRQGRAILAAARAAAEQFRSEQLGALLTAVAGNTSAQLLAKAELATSDPATESPSAGAILAVALFELATPIKALAQYQSGKLPDTAGVLVALAEAQMRQRLASLEAGRLRILLALAEQGVAARANEAGLLIEAKKALNANKLHAAAVAYSHSVSKGQVPGDVLLLQSNHVEYRVWTARERAASNASFAILSPAIGQLQAYGAGGIKPGSVAGILNLIGLGAIAGTN